MEGVGRTGDILCKSAIRVMSTEPVAPGLELPGAFTKNIAACAAHAAGEAGSMVIGNNPITGCYSINALCHCYDLPGNFMALGKGEVGRPNARK